MPPMLGGSGSLKNCFVNVPFQPPTEGLLTYNLVSMGYYLGDLFDTVLLNADANDFWEMIVHHMLTISLFGGSIMQNHMRIGILISFIHNVTDILAAITRVYT